MFLAHFASRTSSFRLLLSGLLLCQMLSSPMTAICAENKALADAAVAPARDGSGYADGSASGGRAKKPKKPALLAFSDFSGCDPKFGSFEDSARNYLLPDPVDGHRCVAGIGANHVLFGKLITHKFPVSRDVWMSGYVYFPSGFQLPAVSTGPNGVCNGGIHLWRLHESMTGSRNPISMDFNVPAGLDVIQFYLFRDNGSKSFAKNTKYQPAKLSGRWQYWQLHVSLGTPGQSDGFVRFYADGKFVDSMEEQPFLPAGADATWGFSYADMQSNIGGCTADWPVQNGWLVSDVRVCKNNLC
jgi:hypothetical protein